MEIVPIDGGWLTRRHGWITEAWMTIDIRPATLSDVATGSCDSSVESLMSNYTRGRGPIARWRVGVGAAGDGKQGKW